jgi:RimJ/RimL family protein N-acetyltransferase
MNIELVKYDRIFLSHSKIWLNDLEIKKLTNTPDFSDLEQETWFNSLKTRKDYLIWGIKANMQPIGVCGLKNITNKDCEYWGYIGEKVYWGKGIGRQIMDLMEKKAKEIHLKSIWLKVLNDNERAYKLYQNTGYIEERHENNLVFMRKNLTIS